MKYDYTIVSRWRNRKQVEYLTKKLRSKNEKVYSFIEGDGTHYQLKDSEQKYKPEEFMKIYESIPDWRNDPRIKEIFEIDLKALKNSKNVILLLPAGKSAHIEAGIAFGLKKNLILIGQQKETESLYLIFDKFYMTVDDFIKSI